MKLFKLNENNKLIADQNKTSINKFEGRRGNNRKRKIHFYFDYEIEKDVTLPDDYQEKFDETKNKFVPFFA